MLSRDGVVLQAWQPQLMFPSHIPEKNVLTRTLLSILRSLRCRRDIGNCRYDRAQKCYLSRIRCTSSSRKRVSRIAESGKVVETKATGPLRTESRQSSGTDISFSIRKSSGFQIQMFPSQRFCESIRESTIARRRDDSGRDSS